MMARTLSAVCLADGASHCHERSISMQALMTGKAVGPYRSMSRKHTIGVFRSYCKPAMPFAYADCLHAARFLKRVKCAWAQMRVHANTDFLAAAFTPLRSLTRHSLSATTTDNGIEASDWPHLQGHTPCSPLCILLHPDAAC